MCIFCEFFGHAFCHLLFFPYFRIFLSSTYIHSKHRLNAVRLLIFAIFVQNFLLINFFHIFFLISNLHLGEIQVFLLSFIINIIDLMLTKYLLFQGCLHIVTFSFTFFVVIFLYVCEMVIHIDFLPKSHFLNIIN